MTRNKQHSFLIIENIDFTETDTITEENIKNATFLIVNNDKKIQAIFPNQISNINCLKLIHQFESGKDNVENAEVCSYMSLFQIIHKHINPFTNFGYIVIKIPQHLINTIQNASILGW